MYNNFTIEYYVKDEALLGSYPAKPGERAEMSKVLRFVNDLPQSLAGEVRNDNLMYETIVEIYPQGSYDSDSMTEEERMVYLNRK